MELGQVILLAIIQGLTEFIPVSSSAHLIFVPKLLGWADQGLAMDVAVHVGTLFALIALFKKELIDFLKGDWRIFKLMVIATVPVVLTGFLFHDMINAYLRAPVVIAISTIVFGIALIWADRKSVQHKELCKSTALKIGVAQAIALIPGTSRSGITLTAGRLLGFSRVEAARISFMMGIPVIALAGGYELIKQPPLTAPVSYYITAMVISGLVAYGTMRGFLKLIERVGLLPFALYRLLVGALLMVFVLT